MGRVDFDIVANLQESSLFTITKSLINVKQSTITKNGNTYEAVVKFEASIVNGRKRQINGNRPHTLIVQQQDNILTSHDTFTSEPGSDNIQVITVFFTTNKLDNVNIKLSFDTQ